MKQILNFILVCLIFIGIIGGIGYTLYNEAYIIAIGLIAAGYVVYPKFVELIKDVIE